MRKLARADPTLQALLYPEVIEEAVEEKKVNGLGKERNTQ